MVEKKGKAGAPLGNQNRVALKTNELRHEAYKQYCEHIAQGKSKRSWVFKHPEFTCCSKTFDKYLQDEIEFPTIHMEVAEAEGYGYWEDIVSDSAVGKNKEANTASLQMLMRNKFQWDSNKNKAEDVDQEILNNYTTTMQMLMRLQEARKMEDSNISNER